MVGQSNRHIFFPQENIKFTTSTSNMVLVGILVAVVATLASRVPIKTTEHVAAANWSILMDHETIDSCIDCPGGCSVPVLLCWCSTSSIICCSLASSSLPLCSDPLVCLSNCSITCNHFSHASTEIGSLAVGDS